METRGFPRSSSTSGTTHPASPPQTIEDVVTQQCNSSRSSKSRHDRNRVGQIKSSNRRQHPGTPSSK